MTTFDANYSATGSTQTVSRGFNPEASLFCSHHSAYFAIDRVDVTGETIRVSISKRLAVDLLHLMYIKDKQLLVYNFICDLLRTGKGTQ
jgi:hypothetical protein